MISFVSYPCKYHFTLYNYYASVLVTRRRVMENISGLRICFLPQRAQRKFHRKACLPSGRGAEKFCQVKFSLSIPYPQPQPELRKTAENCGNHRKPIFMSGLILSVFPHCGRKMNRNAQCPSPYSAQCVVSVIISPL